MHQDPDRCLTTDGLEVELTPNGLWVESRHRTDGARCAFIAAPTLHRLLVDSKAIQATDI